MLRLPILAAFLAAVVSSGGDLRLTSSEDIAWTSTVLPASPSDSAGNLGLAGVYAGKIGDRLVVAGGANFPDGLPSQGGPKVWYSDVYVQDPEEGWVCWPGAIGVESAYGFTVPYDGGLLLIGGCRENECLSSIRSLRLAPGGKPYVEDWGSLPFPLSNMAGGQIGSQVFLAGGVSSMGPDQESLDSFLCLDLRTRQTRELPWPDAPARAFAVGTAQSDGLDNCFYMFSGRNYRGDSPWEVLRDGWAWNPRLGEWKPVGGEFPVMAGCAVPYGTNHILFVGGRSEDPSVPDNVLRLYHTVTASMVTVPVEDQVLPVTTFALRDGDSFVLCSGEVSPGVRTPVILRGEVRSHVRRMGWLDIAVIILYFAILAWIGVFFSKRQKNTDDYFKGGGRIPWPIVGLSIFGTTLSAITFMSIPAKTYATDWSYLLFNFGIVLVVPLITLLFIPKFRSLGVTTAYEYLERRFSPFTRVLCSLAFILYQVGRMGVVLLLPSIALNVVTGLDIFVCIAVMGFLALIYTYMGGIEAVAWTDALQVVVLLGAALAVVFSIARSTPGSFPALVSTAAADGKFSLGSLKFDLRQTTVWTVLIATVFTNITTYGTDQTVVQRYLTTGTEKQARKSVYTNALLSVPATLLFFFVGTALYVFFKAHPSELSLGITDPDAILPWYVSLHIPTGALGLVIAGIFAAAMSTISASMNSAATAYITDIHSKIGAFPTSLKTAKTATLIIGIIGIAFALVMATWDVKSLWDEFSKILGILLGGLGGLFLLGFLCPRANSTGAVSGLLAGVLVQSLVARTQAVHLLLYSSVGFVTCFVVGLLVSLVFPQR
ncbi:MAG: sodium/solute symporter [Bacteroidales bacterium]|nr:sodium/solute symporter [Bacteroidales bacterium]